MTQLNIQSIFDDGIKLAMRFPAAFMVLSILSIPSFFLVEMKQTPSVFLIPSIVFDSVLYFVVTQYYYQAMKGELSWPQAVRRVMAKIFPLTAATLTIGVCGLAGLVLLIIPGLIIFVRWGAYDYLILFEDEGIDGSLKKSWAWTKGHFWRILVILIACYIPQLAADFLPSGDQFILVKFWGQMISKTLGLSVMLTVFLKLREFQQKEAEQ